LCRGLIVAAMRRHPSLLTGAGPAAPYVFLRLCAVLWCGVWPCGGGFLGTHQVRVLRTVAPDLAADAVYGAGYSWEEEQDRRRRQRHANLRLYLEDRPAQLLLEDMSQEAREEAAAAERCVPAAHTCPPPTAAAAAAAASTSALLPTASHCCLMLLLLSPLPAAAPSEPKRRGVVVTGHCSCGNVCGLAACVSACIVRACGIGRTL
jgi:hypothetical protein